MASKYTVAALIMLALLYGYARDRLWILLVAAMPALALGQVIHIPLTPSWIYDATLSEALITAAVIVYLADSFIAGKIGEIYIDGVVMALILYGALSLASYFYITDIQLFVAGMKIITYSFLSYFLAINLLKNDQIRTWAWRGLAALVMILSAQIFYKFYAMGFSSKFFFDRSNILIPMGAIALVSAAIAMLLPPLLGRFSGAGLKEKSRYFFLAAFLLGALAVVLTLGKGAILSLAAGLFYFFHYSRDKRFVFIVSALLFAALSYLFFTPYIEGLYERTVSALKDTNIEFRLDEYETGWKIFRDHPLIGVGAGQQLWWYQKMIDPDYRNFANNFFLQAALDFGAAGLAAMLLVVLAVVFKMARKRREIGRAGPGSLILTGLIAGGITAFFNGLVEVTFFALPYAILFWSMIGLAQGTKKDSII